MRWACVDADGLVLWTTDLSPSLDPKSLFQLEDGQSIEPAPEDVTGLRHSANGWVPLPRQAGPDPMIDLRAERDRRLAASDWTQLPDAPLSDEQKAAWAVYRQALRDMTETAGDWPEPPTG